MRWRRRLQKGLYEDPHLQTVPFWPLTDGEIHYLYWFIQGGIMNADTRWALRRAWGFCARHAWAALAVEMAFRSDYLLGPAILYVDLLERCLIAFPRSGPLQAQRLLRRLRPTGPCTICDMGIYWAAKGGAKTEMLEQGRRTDALVDYALRYLEHWQSSVCRLCAGESHTAASLEISVLCRLHVIEQGEPTLERQLQALRSFLEATYTHMSALDRSYMVEHKGTAKPEDRAALLTAVGWLNGWGPLLALIQPAR
jgi:hypothetical protein